MLCIHTPYVQEYEHCLDWEQRLGRIGMGWDGLICSTGGDRWNEINAI